MIDINTSDRKEQRNFGLVMAVAVTILGLIRWGLHWRGADSMPPLPYYYFALAFGLASAGIFTPALLKPLFDLWIKLAIVLNWIMTRLLLSIIFFLTVLPIGIIMRLFQNDPIDRALDKSANTYWKDAENQTDDPERYKKQY